MNSRRAVPLILVSLWAAALVPAWSDGSDELDEYVEGEVIVRFSQGLGMQEQAALISALGGTVTDSSCTGSQRVQLGEGWTALDAAELLSGEEGVDYAHPNYLVREDVVPGDPRFGELWGLHNIGQTGGRRGADIEATRAWDVTRGSRDVLVAVLDSGAYRVHSDLFPNMWVNDDPPGGGDNDNNGYVDDTYGWNPVMNNGVITDDTGHGTHVAGTIGAVGDNAGGVAGVSWQVTIVPVKILVGGIGDWFTATKGICYAIANDVDIINASWGGTICAPTPPEVSDLGVAIALARDADILFVAAAGNDGQENEPPCQHQPASFDLKNVVSVAASDEVDSLPEWSNYGRDTVHLAAPGVGILSTIPVTPYYGLASGTSMATPHVAGVAALIRTLEPLIDYDDLRQRLLDSVDPVPALAGFTITGGRLNAHRAVSVPDLVPPVKIDSLQEQERTSSSVFVSWVAPGDDDDQGQAARYQVRYSPNKIGDDADFEAATDFPNDLEPQRPGETEHLEVTGLAPDESYWIAVRALDEWNNEGTFGAIQAQTLAAPRAEIEGAPVSLSLPRGRIGTAPLVIVNNSPGTTLDYAIGMADTVGPYVATEPTAPCAEECTPSAPRAGRIPGYRLTTSDDTGDPAFEWEDISGASPVPLFGDDEISPPLELQFDFPLYGEPTRYLWVTTNGWLALRPDTSSPPLLPRWLSAELPFFEPLGIIAPFWDDLDFGAELRATYVSGPKSFVLQFTDVPHWYAPGSYTFQVILEANGEIRFRYLSVTGPRFRATVGLQSQAGDDGVTFDHNDGLVHDQLEIRFRPTSSWLRVEAPTGRVAGGERANVDVAFDTSDLAVGTYETVLRLRTNDPDQAYVEIPVALEVDAKAPALGFSTQGVHEGETLLLQSCQPVVGNGQTVHVFNGLQPALSGEGRFEIGAQALSGGGPLAELLVDGLPLGYAQIDSEYLTHCSSCVTGRFDVSADLMTAFLADGSLRLTGHKQPGVGSCGGGQDRHTMRVGYRPSFDRFDFGAVASQGNGERTIMLENRGDERLEIAVRTDSAVFVPQEESITIDGQDSHALVVSYSPTGSNVVDTGVLRLETNDPTLPLRDVTLEGYAGPPDQNASWPSNTTITVTMPRDSRQSRSIMLWNGTSQQALAGIQNWLPMSATWLKILPSDGTLPPTTGKEATLLFDSTGLAPGTYQGPINVGIVGLLNYHQIYNLVLVVE